MKIIVVSWFISFLMALAFNITLVHLWPQANDFLIPLLVGIIFGIAGIWVGAKIARRKYQ